MVEDRASSCGRLSSSGSRSTISRLGSTDTLSGGADVFMQHAASLQLHGPSKSCTFGSSIRELKDVHSFNDAADFVRSLDVMDLIFGPKKVERRKPWKRVKKDSAFGDMSVMRILVYRIVSSAHFNAFIGAATFFNMIVLIIEVDTQAKGQTVPNWINTSTAVLMWTYVVDIVMKIYGHGWACLTELSNIVDATVVVLDLISFLLTVAIADTTIPSLVFLRAFRLLRLYHLVKSVMVFRELVLMMQGLVSALRAIVFGAFLICLTVTTWSILAVPFLQPLVSTLADSGYFEGCIDCEDAFASVMKSNITFWKTIVAGDSWGTLAVPLLSNFPLSGFILFPAFISISLGLLNVVAAVIVDRQTQARENDDQFLHQIHQEELANSYTKLRALFQTLDEDGGGSLTLGELENNFETNDDFRSMLEVLDIQRADIPTVCEIMDSDGSGEVTYTEFVEKLHQIKFLNNHTLLVFIKQHVDVMRREQSRLLEKVDTLLRAGTNASEEFGSAQGTTDEPELQEENLREKCLRQGSVTIEKSRDACHLHDEFSIDDVQKQLFQKMSSVMLPVVAQVARNCVSYVNSSAYSASETSDCVGSTDLAAEAAPVGFSSLEADLDFHQMHVRSNWSRFTEEKVIIEAARDYWCAKTSPRPCLREDSVESSLGVGESDDDEDTPRGSHWESNGL